MPLLITKGLGQDTPVIIHQRIVSKLQGIITSIKTKTTRASSKKPVNGHIRKKANGTATTKQPRRVNGRAKKKDTLSSTKK